MLLIAGLLPLTSIFVSEVFVYLHERSIGLSDKNFILIRTKETQYLSIVSLVQFLY